MPPRAAKQATRPAPVVEDHGNPTDGLEAHLSKCQEPKATSADVGRLYKEKDALSQINWDSPDCLQLKSRLVACFEARVFYKSGPGQNFLALVYNLHPLMADPINEILKRIVLVFPEDLLASCSSVLMKAWQTSCGGVRLRIEHSVREWMHKALFTSVKTSLRVRVLLSAFHNSTRTKELDDLLSGYYGPILFRHTKVANWEVRFNAIALLCAAFPIIRPDLTAIEFEEKVTAQFRVLKDCMEDPNESVRKTAVKGGGKILRGFWEVLTIEQIAGLLDCIADKAGRDKNSPKTRCAAIEAFSSVVDNPLSHAVMAELLPSTKNLLNDESPLVRLAYADFLVKLARVKTIPVGRFIDMGTLFSRLATDHALSLHHPKHLAHAQISKKIGSVLGQSVFLSSVDDQVEKCVRMAETLPQGFLALMASCDLCASEVERVRLAVAVASRAVTVAVKHKSDARKIATARILLRAASELVGTSALAGVQGSEDAFPADSDSEKLAAFIYKHVIDRDVVRFIDFCVAENLAIISELANWLAQLDGTRLPMTFERLRALLDSQADDTLMRVASKWGMLVDSGSANWRAVNAAVRSSQSPAGLDATISGIVTKMESALRLNDVKTLQQEESEMTTFIQSICGKLPNAKFVPDVVRLVRLTLTSLLRIHMERDSVSSRSTDASSELSAVIHRFNIGLISSLTTAPLPPQPAAKKSRSSQPVAVVDMALSAEEMVDLCLFYVSFLLASSLLAGVPMVATKFDEITRVLFAYISRTRGLDIDQKLTEIIGMCVESQSGAFAAIPLIEGALCLDSIPAGVAKTAVTNFGFSPELHTLLTKLSIAGSHGAAIGELRKQIDAYPDLVSQQVKSALAPPSPSISA